ncbi:MAG TPA: hypothetical protein GXZ90_05440 [Clostridiales bacterium]|nr:hypothetical protein [Clostridiales bacterium]
MSKFHINKHGVPAPCKAKKGNCPLGGEGEHFDTPEIAQEYADKVNEESHGLLPNTISSKFAEGYETDGQVADMEARDVEDESALRKLNNLSIDDVSYEVKDGEVLVDFYNDKLNSGGFAVWDIPKGVTDVEKLVVDNILAEHEMSPGEVRDFNSVNQGKLNKYKINELTYEVENDLIIVDYYDNNINSGGNAVFDLPKGGPKKGGEIEEFVVSEMLAELNK